MPCSDRIFAWRELREPELAVLSCNSKVSGFQNDKIGLHPSVNIALYGDEFFFVVRIRERRGARWLNPVPFPVNFGKRVNIVAKGIAVRDVHILPRSKGKHMCGVTAILLIERHRRRGYWRGLGFSRGNIYHDIFQRISRSGDYSLRHERL